MADVETLCGGCRFFRRINLKSDWGECRRLPPACAGTVTHNLAGEAEVEGVWPWVDIAETGCGEFKP